MNRLYEKYIKTDSLPTLFCPGCGNGIIQYAAIKAFEKMKIRKELACVSGIGCSSWIPCYFKLDVIHSIHGRALPFATGLKISQPDKKIVVFTGDGDCLAIGGNHFLHAIARNIDLTVILVNNNIYGMTGGQKSPTTPLGAKSKTSPNGNCEIPIKAAELAVAMGASYVARWTTAHPVQLQKAIEEGIEHKGFSLIEVISQCPVQSSKEVFGTKKSGEIIEKMKEMTYIPRLGVEEDKSKIKLGLLRKENDQVEYIDNIMANRKAKGIGVSK
ncbi:MAG: thiamine pyrophosphate-dependent enzyme [Anaerovoracaceae bacterium]